MKKDFTAWNSQKGILDSNIFSGKQSVALLSQLRLLDVRRLAYRMGTMRREDFNELKEKLRAFLR